MRQPLSIIISDNHIGIWQGDPKRKIRVPAAPADDGEGPAE